MGPFCEIEISSPAVSRQSGETLHRTQEVAHIQDAGLSSGEVVRLTPGGLRAVGHAIKP